MQTIGQSEYSFDRIATEAAYAKVDRSGAEACVCDACRNYVAVRARLLPECFVSFLKSVGVDPNKEAEAYHMGRVAAGKHFYGGWYHFVGELHKTGDFPPIAAGDEFSFFLCRANAPHLRALDGHKLVEVEFEARAVPWVIDLPEPR